MQYWISRRIFAGAVADFNAVWRIGFSHPDKCSWTCRFLSFSRFYLILKFSYSPEVCGAIFFIFSNDCDLSNCSFKKFQIGCTSPAFRFLCSMANFNTTQTNTCLIGQTRSKVIQWVTFFGLKFCPRNPNGEILEPF